MIIGNGGAEFGVRGYVSAYDAETGQLSSGASTPCPAIPRKPFEQPGAREGREDLDGRVVEARRRRHGLGLDGLRPRARSALHRRRQRLAVESASSAAPAGGDNLFLSSIVALKPDTGEYVWHYQTTPGDTWDYTATQHMILADLAIDGRPRKVLMQAPKNGFFYVLDRDDRRADLGQATSSPINWATRRRHEDRPADREPGRRLRTRKAALVVARPARRPQLAADGASIRRPASSTSRRRRPAPTSAPKNFATSRGAPGTSAHSRRDAAVPRWHGAVARR